MSNFEKQFARALAIRREILHEIKEGKVSRRAMLKKLLYTSGALAVLYQWRGAGAHGGEVAPPTEPFVEEMPHLNLPPHVARPTRLNPLPQETANVGAGEARRAAHQAWEGVPSEQFTYELIVRPAKHSFHPQLPVADVWTFDNKLPRDSHFNFPGPTFHARYGKPITVRIRNELPFPHEGVGSPEISTHLHNMHSPSESDGNPEDFYPKRKDTDPRGGKDPGTWKDFQWVNRYPGWTTDPGRIGDPLEALSSLWYHDHREMFTSHNVYKGLAGDYLIFDELDSGDETDTGLGLQLGDGTRLAPLRLPSGEFDVPVVLSDKLFDGDGRVIFDQFSLDGLIGNKITVNGKIQPFFRVKRRKYRFRVLNASTARVFGLQLMRDPNGPVTPPNLFTDVFLIGVGGNMLPRPQRIRQDPNPVRFQLTPAQRHDVVVDFKNTEIGDHFFVVNLVDQTNGRMPNGFQRLTVDGPVFDIGDRTPIMRIDVVGDAEDSPPVPEILRPLPDLPPSVDELSEAQILDAIDQPGKLPDVANVRLWNFDRTNGQWAINNELFEPDEDPRAIVKKDSAEIWVLQNNSDGWLHPVHIHLEEFRPLFVGRGQEPDRDSFLVGREDTSLLGPGDRWVVFMQFRDFTGRYVMHCHNTVHEDHAMMVGFEVR